MTTFLKVLVVLAAVLTIMLFSLLVGTWALGILVPTPEASMPAVVVGEPASTNLPTATPDPTSEPATATPYPLEVQPSLTPYSTEVPLSPTYISSPTSAPTPTASPTSSPTFPPLVDDVAILLLGTDKHVAADESWRTDSIIILAIHPDATRVGLMSLPRDLWVNIPGRGYDRINVADFLGEYLEYPGGGPALLERTIEENLGIKTHHYVRVDIDGLRGIINALGHITVDVPKPVEDWFPDPDAPDGIRHTMVPTGTQVLDAKTAVDYARSRRNVSDFERAVRQQQVLRAIGKRVLELDALPRAWELWNALQDTFDTDLTWGQLVPLVTLMAKVEPGDVRSQVVDYRMVTDWTTSKGAMVLLPDHEAITRAWRNLLADPTRAPVPSRTP